MTFRNIMRVLAPIGAICGAYSAILLASDGQHFWEAILFSILTGVNFSATVIA